ncbi:hypothetical protein [Deinococcus puniceus]|uniref:DUF11 domain-containing protein n=1 Tax=Deinococcus puniceus TaxID=1182568 RepID=A0A172T6U4_9DEIO|nr:hypothetical protein [Deinococcus puniceus]ANE42765.1 hypothetical protein SU48_02200 [Deinococcus puniceus]
MKVNSRLIALMVAMAAGTAAAAGNTPAGTIISNTATAVFEDPTGPAGNTSGNVASNPVTTTVQPKPDFDIVYSGVLDMGTNAALSATNPAMNYNFVDQVPGAVISTPYVIVNNGNVGSNTPATTPYTVAVAAFTGGTTLPTGTIVQYFTDANANGILDGTDALITGPVSVPADLLGVAGDPNNAIDEGRLNIRQVVTIGTNAPSGSLFSVSPQGTGDVYSGGPPAGPVSTTEATTDLQYTQIKVFAPLIDVVPPSFVPDTTPGGTTTPITTTPVVVPPTGPTGTPVTDPNNPVSPPGTPGLPSDPSTPGYVDPANPGTSITSNPTGDNQIAYPPADSNTAPDVVTFVNTVTNKGLADVVNLFPTIATGPNAGQPIGVNNGDGSFTLPDGTIVKFLNPDGTPATLVGGYPTISVPAGTPGTPSTANFRTEVTFPDTNPVLNGVTNPAQIDILVGIDSKNDTGVVADGTSTNTIMPPAMQFGDSDGPTVGINPVNSVITQTVSPKAAQPTGAGIIASPDTSDATAVFPMDIVNQGEYGDSYTLTTPVVNFPNTAGGTTPAVSVKYVDINGTELPKNAAGNYITPVVAKNEELKVFLVVVVPADAATGSVTVPQTATGNYSTIVATDPNDVVKVAIVNTNPDLVTGNPGSGIDVDKYQTKGATAPTPTVAQKDPFNVLPGDTVRYAIIAKNNFNTPVANFVLSDSAAGQNVYTFSKFVSATVVPTTGLTGFTATVAPAPVYTPPAAVTSATVYYKWTGTLAGVAVTSGGFVTAAPTATNMDTVTTLEVAVDTNGSGTITAADIVPATASIRLDIVVTVR